MSEEQYLSLLERVKQKSPSEIFVGDIDTDPAFREPMTNVRQLIPRKGICKLVRGDNTQEIQDLFKTFLFSEGELRVIATRNIQRRFGPRLSIGLLYIEVPTEKDVEPCEGYVGVYLKQRDSSYLSIGSFIIPAQK